MHATKDSTFFFMNAPVTNALLENRRACSLSTVSIYRKYLSAQLSSLNGFQECEIFICVYERARWIGTEVVHSSGLSTIIGRAIAQAVSRRLPTAAARVQTRVWSCGILWGRKVALGQVFSENFGFPCQSAFHLLLHSHLHYHPRLAQ
jgi:hypothetical protein